MEGFPSDTRRVGHPILVRLCVAAVGSNLLDQSGIGVSQLCVHCFELLIGVELEAKMIYAGVATSRRDREIEARVLKHPLGVVRLVDRRLGAEGLRVEGNALF